ncbi:flavin-containing monooxygenase [Sphingobium estronivorans]|uniref:flavin-containing monooxygenase n=1 Tax=Sphingobium estronivorans TaxID=1577690 RepID=UPI00123A64A9|nr:NAD(P)/FAD-dependent oxidoreductase [Sphingobium estronivorans]
MTHEKDACTRGCADSFDYDVVLIGAGMGGLYQLYRLKEAGYRVLALEAAEGVGGVWHWNRYPGARLDSEAYSYGYTFSNALQEEWNWSEHFAGQPELLRYFNYVADRFDLRRHIRFGNLVTAAHYLEDEQGWAVTTDKGKRYTCRYVIAAVGPLTLPSLPPFPGRDSFAGETCHTSRWPDREISFAGKSVAVIGTGATGVQVIQEVAKTAERLIVFQRTPNYCAPLNNAPIAADEQPTLKARYPEIAAACRSSNGWFMYDTDPRSIFDLADEEREVFLEKLYNDPGIGIWKANFHDIGTDEAANTVVSDFIRRKIRERVRDPDVAERLVPKTFGFGTRRVPLETRYYEVYNQANVQLVDLTETPIDRITPTSIVTTGDEFEVDMIIYATGFDAVTGSFNRIDIRGVGGVKLKDRWESGPSTFLGVHAAGFPNFFMPGGPLASLGNFTPAMEYSVDWVMDLLGYMRDHGFAYVDVAAAAEQAWTDLVRDRQSGLLIGRVKSWITGFNSNSEGTEEFRVLLNTGSAKDYRQSCDTVRRNGYPEFEFSKVESPQSALSPCLIPRH